MGHRRPVVMGTVLATGLVLSACGGGSGGSSSSAKGSSGAVSGSGKTLQVYIGAQTAYPKQQAAWEQRINTEFKKATGGSVAFETYTSGTQEQQKIQTSVVSGQGPDVYETGTTFTPVAYSTGSFVKLSDSDWNTIGGKSQFVPASLAMSGPDQNNLIAVPLISQPFVMVYNKTLFAKAGISSPPKTWDELVADGKKLTKGKQYGLAMDYKDSFDPWKYIWMFANQYGNKLIDGKKATINDPAVMKAYQAYFGFLTKDKIVNPAGVNWASTDALADFASGKSAMLAMTTPGSLPTLTKSPVAKDFAYAPMPNVPPGDSSLPSGGVPATTIVSGQNMVIASYSKKKDLALQYLKLVTSEPEQVYLNKIYGALPTNQAAAQKAAASNPNYKPILAAAQNAKPTPFTGAWSQVQLGLVNVVVQSLPGLSAGSVSDSSISSQLASLQKSAQQAVDQAASAS
jgi:multiple sugar transport system substrate-binding protein